ncbi:predicted protein [Postia placenta Mad-698-R]|nr:predicted protein [Postia placenta Mad-698-R]
MRTLIPEPSTTAKRGLKKAMGLEHDVEKFMDMTKCLRELSREMLDESRLLKDQDRKAWYEFKLQAKKTCPLLMKYEHAWPLGAYMHRYLYDLNMRRNNERVFGTSVAVRGGASDGDEDEPSDEGILDVRTAIRAFNGGQLAYCERNAAASLSKYRHHQSSYRYPHFRQRGSSFRTPELPVPSNKDKPSAGKKRCMPRATRLSNNMVRYNHMTVSEQDPEAWKAFRETAIETYPLLLRYENEWPVHAYMKNYLYFKNYNRKYRARQKSASSGAYTTKRSSRESKRCVAKNTQNLVVEPNGTMLASNEAREDSETGFTAFGSDQDVIPLPDFTYPVSSTSGTVYATAQSNPELFTAYLRGCKPNLEDLAPKLLAAGVYNETRFRYISTWPETEIVAFLKADSGSGLGSFPPLWGAQSDELEASPVNARPPATLAPQSGYIRAKIKLSIYSLTFILTSYPHNWGLTRFKVDAHQCRAVSIKAMRPPIPEPGSREKEALQKAMKLRKNTARFRHFTAQMRCISRKIFDESVPYQGQDPRKIQHFMEVAQAQYPFLQAYEGAWPARCYLKARLKQISHISRTWVYETRRLNLSTPQAFEVHEDIPVDAEGTQIPSTFTPQVTPCRLSSHTEHNEEFGDKSSRPSVLHFSFSQFREIYCDCDAEASWSGATKRDAPQRQLGIIPKLYPIAALVAKIAETFPFLQSYQDAWPVKEYLKGYLRMSRFKLWQTKQATRMGDKAKENVASVIYANISHSHSLTAITAAFKANVTTIRHSDHFEQPKCLDTNERARLIDEMPLSPTKHYINEEIVSIVTASGGMVSSFTTFLRQTTPNLEHLQPRFAQAGVNDETSFRGLSTWPLPEMDAFLKDDMGLSLFEYQEVINALLFDYRKDAVV